MITILKSKILTFLKRLFSVCIIILILLMSYSVVFAQNSEQTNYFKIGKDLTGYLRGIISGADSSGGLFIIALFVALIIGGLHALTPGHGKTIVAAYLVGSKSSAKHAVLLGTIVTFTHTGTVIILTTIMLVASQYFLPQMITPYLELLSGFLIFILGIFLLVGRIKNILRHTHNHTNDHTHNHQHTHVHGNHSHEHALSEITWKSIVTLGLSGGIVPCPDAIAILLLAVSINKIFLGLSVMISFSFGLALVLISIGLIMVYSKNIFSKFKGFDKFGPFVSVLSALIVLILGIIITIGAMNTYDFYILK